jgi:hypothetical protein
MRRPSRLLAALVGVCIVTPTFVWPGGPAVAATAVFRPAGGGFESPTLPAGGSQEGPSTMAWNYVGQAGIARTGSMWTTGATPVPQGSQVAYLRNAGRISRPIGLTRNDVLRFSATQRRSGTTGSQGLGVYVNGVLQGSVVIPSASQWTTHRVRLSIPREAAYTLEIRGATTQAGQDRTALLDQVVIEREAWDISRPAFVPPGPRLYSSLPASGLPAERRSRMRTTTDVLQAGVVGLRTQGDSEPEVDAQVLAFAEWNDRIYVGGKFAQVQRGAGAPLQQQPYLAAFDRTTGAWIDTFRPRLDGTVWDMAVTSNGLLVVGGQFTNANGVAGTSALVALDPSTGNVVPGWRANVTLSDDDIRPKVRALDVQDGWVYIGGRFDRITGGASAARARVENLGRVAVLDGRPSTSAFAPAVDGSVTDIDATTDRVYAAGHIDGVNGTTRSSVVVLRTSDGSPVGGLGPIVQTSRERDNHYMQGVLAVGGDVWVNGSQHATQVYRRSDMRLVRSFVSEPHGDGQALAFVNGHVYSGSHANRRTYVYSDAASWPLIESGSRTDAMAWVGAWDAWTKDYLSGWVPDMGSREGEGVWEIFVDSRRCLWVGGDINRGSTVNGIVRYASGFARLCPVDDVPPSTPGSPTRVVQAAGVRLGWTASSDPQPGAVSYEIVRNDRVIASGLTSLGYTDTTGGAADRYVIRAVDAAGNRSVSTVRLGG